MKLNKYIDIPMHLLFKGIVKSVIDLGFDYLKDNNEKQVFKNDLFDYMYHINILQCYFVTWKHFHKFQIHMCQVELRITICQYHVVLCLYFQIC